MAAISPHFGEITSGQYRAGIEYPLIAEGKQDFVVFKRMPPRDHASGILLLEEADGTARDWDGTSYRADTTRSGLFAASDPECWQRVSDMMNA